MPNPSTRWDRVPVFGVWLKIDDTPSPGKVVFGVGQRVTRVDGREIHPEGAQLEVTIGKQDEQDATVRSTVRAAWRAADAAAAGANFDAVAWDTRWDMYGPLPKRILFGCHQITTGPTGKHALTPDDFGAGFNPALLP